MRAGKSKRNWFHVQARRHPLGFIIGVFVILMCKVTDMKLVWIINLLDLYNSLLAVDYDLYNFLYVLKI